MKSKEFYNEYYSKERQYNQHTVEGFLYKILKKYEISRYEIMASYINNLDFREKKILDLGCGEGRFFGYLNQKNNLYGLDIAGVRLSKIAKDKYTIIEGDLDKTFPFDNDSFDIVTSMSVLEHVFSVEHQLQETYRILKSGGYFFLEVPNVAFLPNGLRLFFGKTPVTGDRTDARDDNHLHYFTKNDLKKYLEKFGFEVVKITGSGIFARLRERRPSLLCGDLVFICKKII